MQLELFLINIHQKKIYKKVDDFFLKSKFLTGKLKQLKKNLT